MDFRDTRACSGIVILYIFGKDMDRSNFKWSNIHHWQNQDRSKASHLVITEIYHPHPPASDINKSAFAPNPIWDFVLWVTSAVFERSILIPWYIYLCCLVVTFSEVTYIFYTFNSDINFKFGTRPAINRLHRAEYTTGWNAETTPTEF